MKRSIRRQWTGALAAAWAAAMVYVSRLPEAPSLDSIRPELPAFASASGRGRLAPASNGSSVSNARVREGDYLQLITTARAEAASERWAGASAAYGSASELVPASVEAALGKQQALIQQGRYAESERAAHQVLKLDPANYWSRLWLAWALFNRHEYRDAGALYQDVLRAYPSEIEPAIGLGYAQLNSGERSLAAATFGAILARFPRDSRALAGAALTR